MKGIKKILLWFFLIIFSLSVVGFFLLGTNSGLNFCFKIAAKVVSGKITVHRLDGSLFSSISAEKIYFKNKGVEVSSDKLYLEGNLKNLFFKKNPISVIHADNLKINLKNDDSDKVDLHSGVATIKDCVLPIFLGLREVKINNVYLRKGESKTVKISGVALQLKSIGKDIESLKFNLYSKQANISIDGFVKKKWGLSWDINVKNIGDFLQGMTGSLESSGKVYGKRVSPEIEADIKLIKFKYGDVSFSSFQGGAYIDLSLRKNSQFKLLFDSPKVDEFIFDRLNLSGAIIPTKFKNVFGFGLSVGESVIRFPKKTGLQSLVLKNGKISGSFDGNDLTVNGSILFKDSNPIDVELKIPGLKGFVGLFNNQSIEGSAKWQTKNLSIFQGIFPQLEDIKGNIDIQYGISGTLQHPKIKGNLKLKDASLHVPDLNIRLKDIAFDIENVGNKFNYHGSLNGKKGGLNLSGEAFLSKKGIDGIINIKGDNFLIADTKEYMAIVSPNLKLQNKDGLLVLDGVLSVSEALIKPDGFTIDNSLPPEIVYVDEKKRERKGGFDFQADVDLRLGDKVFVDILGLKGEVKGRLQLIDQPKKNTAASGDLYIEDGKYDIYGQELKITKGKLHFLGGEVTNPEVDIEATRSFKASNVPVSLKSQDQSLVVGIRMTGMLNNPKIFLFSVPGGLSNPDILSYLIVGKPSDQISENKAQLLLQAATALNFGGVSQVGGLISDLRKKLGFSEFGFVEETSFNDSGKSMFSRNNSKPGSSLSTSTSFVLGKFLTPKIYASYSVGLLDESNIFRIRYYINKYFSVQSESGSSGDNAVDFIYTIEH